MKTCYTAIFGNYDDLKEPMFKSQHWNYVCFTDQNLVSDTWEIRKVPVMPCGQVKTARWYKINFHKCLKADLSLWVDATFIINVDLNRWWKRFVGPFTTVLHPFDDCIYTDIVSCMSGRKDDTHTLARQYSYYVEAGIPKNNGLISSGILMRSREKRVIEFCETWWDQVEKFSTRDQVAFGYANWKHPGIHHSIKWDYTKQEEFIHIPHLHKTSRIDKLKSVKRKYG